MGISVNDSDVVVQEVSPIPVLQDEIPKAAPTDAEIEAGGMKYIEAQVKALSGGVRLQTRNLLMMLTRNGIDENIKRQIRETIERAIIAALDYGVDIDGKPMPIRSNGRLGKLEIEYAGTMSKLKEMGMVLMAKKMSKDNFDLDKYAKGATIDPVPVDDTPTASEIDHAING